MDQEAPKSTIEGMTSQQALELQGVLCEFVFHEERIMTDRLGQFFLLEGVLFAAIALSWNKEQRLSCALSFVGMAASVFGLCGLLMSIKILLSLCDLARKHDRLNTHVDQKMVMGYLLVGRSTFMRVIEKFFPQVWLPVLFCVVWIYVTMLAC